MPDPRIYVDFNDLQDGGLSALTRHAADPSAVVVGAYVTLLDEEGNCARGRVTAVEDTGLARIEMLPGTWHDRLAAPALDAEQLSQLVSSYAARMTSFSDFYRMSEPPPHLVPTSAGSSFGWLPILTPHPSAVPSSV